MIERIVLFKLRPEHATEAGRREIADHSRAVLTALPMVRSVTVGVPADEGSRRSWDISLVVRFDSSEEMRRYVDDPDHRAYVDEYMLPRAEVRKAWAFEVTE